MQKLNNYHDIYSLLVELNSERYLDNILLSTKKIENTLAKSTLDVTGKPRHEHIEKKLNPPSFIVIFYYYIFFFKEVPNLQQYISFYHEINSEWVAEFVDHDLKSAFNGRLSRTYPSLVRDVHCYFLLKESKAFKRVVYKMKYDLKGKVDVFVQSFSGAWYGLQLRVDTQNSDEFYKMKPYRGAIEVPGIHEVIDMPLNLSNARSIRTKKNDLKVYSGNELIWLSSVISEIENKQPIF